MFHNRICFLLLSSLSVFFYPHGSYAVQKLWPVGVNMTQALFAPYLLNGYVDAANLADFGEDAEDLDHYMLVPLNPLWDEVRSCNLEWRPRGYLQTLGTTNEFEDYFAAAAVPFSLSLRTHQVGLEKDQLLTAVLLTVSVLELNLDTFELETRANFSFTFREICGLDPNCRATITIPTIPLVINFEGPIVTPQFLFKHGQELSLRATWSSAGVCNEDSLAFSMGDQFRIITIFP